SDYVNRLLYSPDSDYVNRLLYSPTSDNETIYEDEGLSKDAVYCYQVRAYNSDGEVGMDG
ncbi:MAG: fibronectin type III domain-containing protein, partial [bacterium]|nr:fibronectin type III domain-containing protein [bacterium]